MTFKTSKCGDKLHNISKWKINENCYNTTKLVEKLHKIPLEKLLHTFLLSLDNVSRMERNIAIPFLKAFRTSRGIKQAIV